MLKFSSSQTTTSLDGFGFFTSANRNKQIHRVTIANLQHGIERIPNEKTAWRIGTNNNRLQNQKWRRYTSAEQAINTQKNQTVVLFFILSNLFDTNWEST